MKLVTFDAICEDRLGKIIFTGPIDDRVKTIMTNMYPDAREGSVSGIYIKYERGYGIIRVTFTTYSLGEQILDIDGKVVGDPDICMLRCAILLVSVQMLFIWMLSSPDSDIVDVPSCK